MNKFRELLKSTLVVETPEGDLQGNVSNVNRGIGYRKNYLIIVLLTQKMPPTQGQCWVSFNGKKYGAVFSNVMGGNEIYKAELETIIDDISFWE